MLIGTQTLGKGAVNQFSQLSDGSAIYLTSAKWLTPNKQPIEGRGVIPDEIVELTKEDIAQGNDVQLEHAIEYIKSRI